MTLKSDLDKAIARRARLAEEIEKLDNLIELWTWWAAENAPAGARSHTAESLSDDGQAPAAVKPSDRLPHPESFASPAEVIREALILLSEHGRPLKRGQLLKELSAHGVNIKGLDKSKVLGTTLWRAKEKIVSIDGWGYWIKDRPCPLAGYRPQDADIADLLG